MTRRLLFFYKLLTIFLGRQQKNTRLKSQERARPFGCASSRSCGRFSLCIVELQNKVSQCVVVASLEFMGWSLCSAAKQAGLWNYIFWEESKAMLRDALFHSKLIHVRWCDPAECSWKALLGNIWQKIVANNYCLFYASYIFKKG